MPDRDRRPGAGSPPLTIDVHLGADDLEAALEADVVSGLSERPLQLPPKWFYDDLGSRLFDAITALPEYYPTRRETEILLDRRAQIARIARVTTLVELGSGTSTKTRILLDALDAGGKLRRFVPVDVSESTLRSASAALSDAYPGLAVHAVVGDFERHLGKLPGGDRRLVAFLGGTIGNLEPGPRVLFLEDLAAALAPGDLLLLGTDLVKEPSRLVLAYDDPIGVTAAFNRNVLAVLNRRLGAGFRPEVFDHEAIWDAEREWIEMRLRARTDQTVSIPAVGLGLEIAAGEAIRTEVSAKFRREGVERELSEAGLRLHSWWTDQDGDFALSLSIRS
jgi:L-histidine N-alpha-methyltransferase